MKVNLHFECVGEGDCLLLNIYNNETYNILIDCGKNNSKIKELFKNYNIAKLDHLIVTHIDNDHIIGLVDLLENNSELKIENIWFNCYQHLPDQESIPLTPFQRKKIESLYNQLPTLYENIEGVISAAKALTLAEILNKNIAWKKVWYQTPISVNERKSWDFNGFGKFEIISPTDKELQDLEEVYKIEFCKKLFGKSNYKEIENSKEIYELLLRILEQEEDLKSDVEYSISAKSILTKRNVIDYSNAITNIDNSPTNRSSIAFIWEMNNHKILFLGDAAPDIILKHIKEKKHEVGIKQVMLFDAIKVSHHGSNRSISNELLEEIDTEIYIFSGYSSKRPDEITISKIISRPLIEGIKNRTLIFNCENDIVKNFRSNETLKKEYNYDVVIDSKIEWKW